VVEAQVHSALAGSVCSQPSVGAAADADKELIDRIAAADTQAMRTLITRHNIHVFRYVLGIVKDQTLAEDILGEIFFDVWRQAYQFEARARVSTWLFAIARHKAMSALRRRRMHENLDEALDIVDPCENAEVTLQKTDRDKILSHCLSKLSSGHREVLDLVYYHEEPIDSVATILGIPLNTVKTRMFYARRHLAAMLAKAGIDCATP
jgi:RNA polymerase sigma-70 factor (ECF subfamily)